MSKQKHIPVLTAEIHVAVPYDPADLLEAGTIQAQIKVAAQKLTGFQSIRLGTGKIPAPAEKPAVVVAPPEPDLTPPAFLKRG